MNTPTLTLNGIEYSVSKMNALDSLMLSRLVAPVLPAIFHDVIGGLVKAIRSKPGTDADKMNEVSLLLSTCEPVLQAIADMPDERWTKIITLCLGTVQRNTGKTWASIMPQGKLLFDDIDAADVLRLVVLVIQVNLKSFMKLLGDLSVEAPEQ